MGDLLDIRDLCALLGCHKYTIWRLIRGDTFPAPLHLGKQLRRWQRSAVEQWLEGRAQS